MLDNFAVQPADLTSVVLVRHAKAGARESWDGPDELRPLDAKGRKQAAALRDELVPFGAAALHQRPDRTLPGDARAAVAAAAACRSSCSRR